MIGGRWRNVIVRSAEREHSRGAVPRDEGPVASEGGGVIADLTASVEREALMRMWLCDLYPGEVVRTRLYLGLLG